MMTQDFDNQVIAQHEFDQYIEQQSLQLALSADQIEFQAIDGFYYFEAIINQTVIATIWNDTSESSSYWVVEVNGIEVYRSYLYSEATDFIKTAYATGTLQHLSETAVEA
jgi:hypothetical protein